MAVDHYENFPVASRLVPARLRPAVIAIYRFARAADDLADEGDVPVPARLAALAAFDDALAAIARGETPPAPPFPELAAAVRGHRLPLAPMHDLVSAFRQDVTKTRYPRYTDLLDYCRRSANPVGRLLLALYERESPDNLAASDAVCTGLQLTNFWQDVAGDWQRGRVYLPLEDLARFGVAEAQFDRRDVDAQWRALLAFETARARALLAAGRPLVRALPARLGLELSAVIAGGTRILDRIDAVGGDVFRHRPMLGPRDWIAVGFRALVPPRIAEVLR
ncbi:MAG TPA: squalene synthase HpnC [Casimicrobiaceae bacterium]